MKFDIYLTNPPYQAPVQRDTVTHIVDSTAMNIYQHFIDIARRARPRYIVFITPARWYASGRGLEEWRQTMLADNRLAVIVDFLESRDLFGNEVRISGGVCYWLWDRDKTDKAVEVIPEGDWDKKETRILDQFDVFLREQAAVPILEKVLAKDSRFLSECYLGGSFFNITTSTPPPRYTPEARHGAVDLYMRYGIAKITEADMLAYALRPPGEMAAMINKYKVVLTRCTEFWKREDSRIFLRCEVFDAPSVSTGSFFILRVFDTKREAVNFKAFMDTRFARFMMSLRSNTHNVNRGGVGYVPLLDATRPWSDHQLYARYKLTPQEIAYIERKVSPSRQVAPLKRLDESGGTQRPPAIDDDCDD